MPLRRIEKKKFSFLALWNPNDVTKFRDKNIATGEQKEKQKKKQSV